MVARLSAQVVTRCWTSATSFSAPVISRFWNYEEGGQQFQFWWSVIIGTQVWMVASLSAHVYIHCRHSAINSFSSLRSGCQMFLALCREWLVVSQLNWSVVALSWMITSVWALVVSHCWNSAGSGQLSSGSQWSLELCHKWLLVSWVWWSVFFETLLCVVISFSFDGQWLLALCRNWMLVSWLWCSFIVGTLPWVVNSLSVHVLNTSWHSAMNGCYSLNLGGQSLLALCHEWLIVSQIKWSVVVFTLSWMVVILSAQMVTHCWHSAVNVC